MKPLDTAALAALPNDLRRQVLEALDEAEAAECSGNEERIAAATSRVTKLHAEVQAFNESANVDAVFRATKGVTGTKAVMEKFAGRAGVKP